MWLPLPLPLPWNVNFVQDERAQVSGGLCKTHGMSDAVMGLFGICQSWYTAG